MEPRIDVYDPCRERRERALEFYRALGLDSPLAAQLLRASVRMIERHYGALLDGAHNVIASPLDAFEAELERAIAE